MTSKVIYMKEVAAPPGSSSCLSCGIWNCLKDYLPITCFRADTHPFSLKDDPSGMESWTHCCSGERRSDSQGDDFLPEREQVKDSLGSAPDTK